ncbi:MULTISPECIES: hypothetical protein [Rhizobium]|uniref:hypothetical protein n=1 Tax=Rhizobium TaxID=379 RepID=UPI0017AF882A|nr:MULTISPECIES: hypothetical protein [Rhizobium]MBY5754278.1 hypothetical protein [Rhizobium leguminosarum]MCH4546152.1 hypothetical protein [Rhizobium changzhiense]MCV9942310.1 hypothetical protein [Rhizobium sp. BT-175]MCW0015729.1 hypothetical protein [Rhizobium sp. BT-226]NNU48174.1 hypothetical protein [Rhizobium changzhiense]
MSQTSIWNIVQALSAFKSQRRRDANHEHALRELRRFPPHLLADCQREMELTVPPRPLKRMIDDRTAVTTRPAA